LTGAQIGTVELVAGGVTYEAGFSVVAGMIHLDIAGHRKVVAVVLARATFEESALYVLQQFVANHV
jgi:hypothetical protein